MFKYEKRDQQGSEQGHEDHPTQDHWQGAQQDAKQDRTHGQKNKMDAIINYSKLNSTMDLQSGMG
jgi:hypothetical protein